MKAVVSATIFCNLATLPKSMTSDAGTPNLPVQPPGGYAADERLTEDHDSNGWPQTPRESRVAIDADLPGRAYRRRPTPAEHSPVWNRRF
jgi:hypothetical protein